jgi:hypothetical protein
MKVCIEAHVSPLFGEIPVGSLWADDSPYVLDDFAHCFADVVVDESEPEQPKPVRKFKPKGDD